MRLQIVKLCKETHNSLDKFVVHKTFLKEESLSEALAYWKAKKCHRWGSMAIILVDANSVCTLKLSSRMFHDEELEEVDEISGD